MKEKIIEILKEYDALVSNIVECDMEIRINDGEPTKATTMDKLEVVREGWFETVQLLADLGIDIDSDSQLN
jgi:hypothetical protein